MGDRISLKTLLALLGGTTVLFMLARYAMIHQETKWVAAIFTCAAIPLCIFFLYGVVYLMLMPFGILTDITQESQRAAESPFAGDRLPESQIPIPEQTLESNAH